MTNWKGDITKIGILGAEKFSPNMEIVLFNLGRMLKNSFELHLITGSSPVSLRLQHSYHVHSFQTFQYDPAGIRYALSACRRFIKEWKPALIVNVCSPASLGYAVASIGRRYGIPNIVRMTGDSFGEARVHRKPWKRFKAWFLHGKLAGLAYKNAGCILAIGENLKVDLIRHGYSSEKIFVLPQPFDPDLFKPVIASGKKEAKNEVGLESGRKTILFVGRLSWLKGADRLLKIVEGIGKSSDAFQFCMLGKGEYQKAFARFPEELVHCAGAVPHSLVFRYYQAADLLVFPSRTEGLPNAILEAMACRVPIIASPVGDIPNWVSHVATEPEEYIEYILRNHWHVDELPSILNFDRLKKEYVSLFKRVIQGHRG